MSENKKISLDTYLEKASSNSSSSDGEGQKEETKTIYYITGKSESEVLASPYLAQFKENKVDVLLLTDHIDSFIVQTLTEYKGAKLKSITADDIEL